MFEIGSYNLSMRSEINMLKKEILHASIRSKEGHVPSAFSILDILYVFFHSHKKNHASDNMILSKGHGALALYAVLASAGFIEKNWFQNFAGFNSPFGGHPDVVKVPEVIASTGSLGHGLPIATGIAKGYQIKNENKHVFCLLGDGELNEGTFWESSLIALHHNLKNLVVILDLNDSSSRALEVPNMIDVGRSLGWNTISVNGHDLNEIESTFKGLSFEKPTLVAANTIKGYGVSFMENNPAWHHRFLNADELNSALGELK